MRICAPFLFILFNLPALAADPDATDRLVQRGLQELYNLRLDRAYDCADSLTSQVPDDPRGYLLRSMAELYEYAFVTRIFPESRHFTEQTQKAISLARAGGGTLNKTDCLFLEGVGFANLAMHDALREKWFQAFQNGRRAQQLHRAVVARDSAYADAHLAIGVFNYYGNTLPHLVRFVSRLVGLTGDTQFGLVQVKRAYERGKRSRMEAATFLASFSLEQGSYETALDIYRKLTEEFPRNPYFGIHTGRTLFRLELYREAETELRKLCVPEVDVLPACGLRDYYLARIAMVRNEYKNAALLLRRVVADDMTGQRIGTFDAWLPGDARFRLAECLEFLAQPDSARKFYELAAAAEGATEAIRDGSRARLDNPRSPLELLVTRRCNRFGWQGGEVAAAGLAAFSDSLLRAGEMAFLPLLDFTVGRELAGRGQFQQAISKLRRVLESPESGRFHWLRPEAHFQLAVCFMSAGDAQAARSHEASALSFTEYEGRNRLAWLIERNRQREGITPGF